MKILFIADVGPTGGANFSLLNLTEVLNRNPSNRVVVLTSGITSLNKKLELLGIENYAVGFQAFMIPGETGILRLIIKFIPRLLQYYISYRSAIQKVEQVINVDEFDIIHTNLNRCDLGAALARKYSKPHVWHIREFAEEDYKCVSLRKNYIKYMSDNADVYIAISEAVRKAWIEKGLPEAKITKIYNGVSIENIQKSSIEQKKDKILKNYYSRHSL